MLFFGVCFFLYFIKLSAGNGFWTNHTLIVLCETFAEHLTGHREIEAAGWALQARRSLKRPWLFTPNKLYCVCGANSIVVCQSNVYLAYV